MKIFISNILFWLGVKIGKIARIIYEKSIDMDEFKQQPHKLHELDNYWWYRSKF